MILDCQTNSLHAKYISIKCAVKFLLMIIEYTAIYYIKVYKNNK